MNRQNYDVTVIAHLDGTFTTMNSDIRGLHLSTSDLRSMRDELVSVGSRLLRTNHGLTENQVQNSTVNIKVRVEQSDDVETFGPRLHYEENAGSELAA